MGDVLLALVSLLRFILTHFNWCYVVYIFLSLVKAVLHLLFMTSSMPVYLSRRRVNRAKSSLTPLHCVKETRWIHEKSDKIY